MIWNDEGKRKISLSLGHLHCPMWWNDCRANRTSKKILLFSMLSFVCFSSSTSEILLQVRFFLYFKRFFPFSNVNANLNRQLWCVFFFVKYFPFLYNIHQHTCAGVHMKRKRHTQWLSSFKWMKTVGYVVHLFFCCFLLFFVVVFAWDPVNIRLSDLLNVTLN